MDDDDEVLLALINQLS